MRNKAQVGTKAARSTVVSKMPFKMPWGQSGWYSGEVDHFGIPDGKGRMRLKSGEDTSASGQMAILSNTLELATG
jgi:hypothetical protein